MSARKYILEFRRAPGDVMMLTALVRDIKLTFGDEILVDIRTPYPDIWRNNPHLTPLNVNSGAKVINFDRGRDAPDRKGIKLSNTGVKCHYCTMFHRAFTEKTGIKVDLLYSKPDIHLTEEEKATPLVSGRYWIVVPGYKIDMTNKAWLISRWNEVIRELRGKGLSFVQEGVNKPGHINPPLEGALDLINKTSIRDLTRNIYHAEGVICLCSLPMHLAAALEKPCVVLFGSREPIAYEWYRNDPVAFGDKALPPKVEHVLLHSLGKLPCCTSKGCWLRRVVPLGDGKSAYDRSLCKRSDITTDPSQPVPECQSLIETRDVVKAVLSYYERGTLAPIT